jgi:hypothetical protein
LELWGCVPLLLLLLLLLLSQLPPLFSLTATRLHFFNLLHSALHSTPSANHMTCYRCCPLKLRPFFFQPPLFLLLLQPLLFLLPLGLCVNVAAHNIKSKITNKSNQPQTPIKIIISIIIILTCIAAWPY